MKTHIRAAAKIDGVVAAFMAGIAGANHQRYGTLLLWSGVLLIVVGGMAAGGSNSVADGEYNLKFDQKIRQPNLERSEEKFTEIEKSYDFGVVMATAGAILITIGLILNKIITGEQL